MTCGKSWPLGVLLIPWLVAGQLPPSGPRHLPPPLRVHIPFEAAWKGMTEQLAEMELDLVREDRAQGRLLTDFVEFSSGPLAEKYLTKIAERPKLENGEWVRVEYQYDIIIELVTDRESLVTVDTNVRALQRPFLGEPKWVQIRSIGRLEKDLLTAFGQRLFGQSFSLAVPRKNLYDYRPDDLETGEVRPHMTGPGRKP